MYSLNSAWFTFDEGKCGSLEGGKYADLAVLSDDYLTVGRGGLRLTFGARDGRRRGDVWRRAVRGTGGEVGISGRSAFREGIAPAPPCHHRRAAGARCPRGPTSPVRDLRQRRAQNRRRRLRKSFAATEPAVPLRLCHAVARISEAAPDRLSADGGVETETAAQLDMTFWAQNDPMRKRGCIATARTLNQPKAAAMYDKRAYHTLKGKQRTAVDVVS
jgi:hypothetical protein